MVRLRRRGFWIPSRDAAGLLLPDFDLAFALIICLPPDRSLLSTNCAGRT
jgi:hypothetical protein